MRILLMHLAVFLVSQMLLGVMAFIRLSPPLAPFLSGYLVHGIVVFISTASLFWILSHDKIRFLYAFEIAVAYGMLIALGVEVLQLFVAHRHADFMDVIWGWVGVMAFVIVELLVIRPVQESRKEK